MAEKRPPRSLQTDADREFWDWCNKGELRIQKCDDCGAMPFPQVEACESCGSDKLSWTPMSGEATLFSWCSINRDYYRGAFPLPWDTIMVELTEGPVLMSNPVGFSNAEAELGMPLRLAWLDCEDEHGAYRLPVFERAS
jgi:hypothetical protein